MTILWRPPVPWPGVFFPPPLPPLKETAWPAPFLWIGAPSGTRAHLAARGEGGDNGYGLQGAGTDSMDGRQGCERHIVTRAEKDSVTGEEITSVELSEITVMARSKQVAERNGKINLDFVVTVPGRIGQQQVATPAGPQWPKAFGLRYIWTGSSFQG